MLRPPAGEVPVRYDGELTLIAADPDWGPPFEFVELGSPEEVDRLEAGPTRDANVAVWAWLDEEAGLIRERVFVPGGGIVEDEATGSAALRLVDLLGRELEIRQGRGSVLHARPGWRAGWPRSAGGWCSTRSGIARQQHAPGRSRTCGARSKNPAL